MNRFMIEYTGASNIGMRRSNQDNYMVEGAPAFDNAAEHDQKCGVLDTGLLRLLCVCDGVGGGTRGDLAALTALRAIGRVTEGNDLTDRSLDEVLELVAEAAQEAVVSKFWQEPIPGGCTLVMLAIRGDEWAFLNIGDSPGFLWKQKEGVLEELSVRHNLEWEKRRRGEIPDPHDGCYLQRYLGKRDSTAMEQAHTVCGTLCGGDKFLLCSDGVTNAMSAEELGETLAGTPYAADLVWCSAQNFGADNCTAVCIYVKETENED